MPEHGMLSTLTGPPSPDPARRMAIIRLLETMDDGLPVPSRIEHTRSGFVNEPAPRTCPDCLANGRPMKGCETCGGSGVVRPGRLGQIATPDVRADDGRARDAYAEDKIQPYGIEPSGHDRRVAIDNAIRDAGRALAAELRPISAVDELDQANREPYAWERTRNLMRARYDYDALAAALEQLRQTDGAAYSLLHSVYVYQWLQQPSTTVEAILERGLAFIGERMPDTIRRPDPDPGLRVVAKLEPKAGQRARTIRDDQVRARAREGASARELAIEFGMSLASIYTICNRKSA